MDLDVKIENFYKRFSIYKKALEKIIKVFMEKCEYINGESLRRHNWGNKPQKLKNIPKNMNIENYEKELLNALENNINNDNSIIELLWGDIQLGKRIQACIIMWFSVYILRRPVLYIFRNLEIDQKQLQEDIVGTEESSFNIQFIKKIFDEFNEEIENVLSESDGDDYKYFKLPELRDINANDVINKLGNKEAISSTDIFCCLMNYKQLEKINNKFNEYICNNEELVNMTILIDESDLMAPTSSNDKLNKNDEKDTTECERLLAKIYKKVKYVLHITGTAHSLLYNITTKLFDTENPENNYVQLKISKVHKMKRDKNYYGLFNDNINFNTSMIKTWWECIDEKTGKNRKYTIEEDYNINIKNIIQLILKRKSDYNSLLISEEKIRINQFNLVEKIMQDYSKLFIIIFHGNCLRLYFNKKYLNELKNQAKLESKNSLTQRLNQKGGIYDEPIYLEKGRILPNNYCYYDFDTKKINIKMVYKLLRMLFENSEVKHKTVITITGKYGERGYSFTSDDFKKYTFHITDQYFVSHSTFNCTDISQRLRIQGKYNDEKLKTGETKLILWTTKELEDVVKNFYVKFIREIERNIMDCNNWEEIKELIENIIDNGELKLGKYMKYIDVAKKRKSIMIEKKIEKENNGFRLIKIEDMTDDEISKWCIKQGLPKYNCVNDIHIIDEKLYENNKVNKPNIPIKINLKKIDDIINYFNDKKKLDDNSRNILLNLIKKDLPEELKNHKIKNKSLIMNYDKKYPIEKINNKIIEKKEEDPTSNCNANEMELFIIGKKIDEFNSEKGDCYIKYYNDEKKILKEKNVNKNPILCQNDDIFITYEKKIKFSKMKILNDTSENYYWKTPDDWLYLNKGNNKDIVSLKILDDINILEIKENIYDENIKKFADLCCKKTEQKNLRIGIKEIYIAYEKWCKDNNIKNILTYNNFKQEFEKNGYKQESSKGIDINNKPGKRGYNIILNYNEKKVNKSLHDNKKEGNNKKIEIEVEKEEIEDLEKELNEILKKPDKKISELDKKIPKLEKKTGSENKWKQEIRCIKCKRENYNPVWNKGYLAICKLCYNDDIIYNEK